MYWKWRVWQKYTELTLEYLYFVLSIYQIQKTEQHFYNEDKKTNKYTHSLRNTWRTLPKLANKKSWTTKYQRINTQPMKTKTIKYTHRLR